jgi:co-chaperonin GroES (HSP10)
MKPVLHRLLVKVDPVEKKTASGIVLAINERSEKKAAITGTVVEVGNTAFISFGSTAEQEGIKPGTRVQYAKFAGAEIDSEYIWLNDEDILGVVNE